MPTLVRSRSRILAGMLASLLVALPAVASAQITASEYAARRDSLAARVQNGVVVAFGGRTPVSDFGPFYQLPAFHYLTNFDEPDAAFVMVVQNGRGSSTLFLTPVGAREAFYYGRRPDSASVVRDLGVHARTFSSLAAYVDSLASARLPIYTLADFSDADFAEEDSLTRGQQFIKMIKAKHASAIDVRDGHEIVDALRAKKSPAEIALLRRAAQISDEGHRAAMLIPEPTKEYEIQAALEGTFLRLGGARPAYGSIVGGGVHGTQLHYMRDRGDVKPGDVVVMDAATEYEGYAADVTRTLPVSGKFTPEQRAIYQLVRDAQAAAERNSKPGMSSVAAKSVARAPCSGSCITNRPTNPMIAAWTGRWPNRFVRTMPGWTAMARTRDPAAVSRRCSSKVNSRLASLLSLYAWLVRYGRVRQLRSSRSSRPAA